MKKLSRSLLSGSMILFTCTVSLMMALSTSTSGVIKFGSTPTISLSARSAHAANKPSKTYTPTPDTTFFVLVIGNDYRPGVEGHRADAIHVIAVNPEEKRATILNFPRDTNVAIPGHGRSKINAANAYGGSALTAQTLEQLMGISISYVLEVDFAGFKGLVNDLGGLNVNVEKDMHDKNSGTNFSPGPIRMNGDQALAFSRDRHSFTNGDIQRTTNQGALLVASLRELIDEKTTVTSRFESAALIAKNAALTNLTLRDIYFLMQVASSIDPGSVANITVPWSGSNTLAPQAHDLFNDVKDNAIINTYVP